MRPPEVELTELRYFLAAASAGSFAEGARIAHVSPPAVSKAIRRLEDTLELDLFHRQSHSVRLTAAGEALVERASRLLDAAQRLPDDVHAAATGRIRGVLAVGCTEELTGMPLATTIARLSQRHPDLMICARTLEPEAVAASLRQGELEVGLVFGDEPVPADCRARQLVQSPNRLVCGPRHPAFDEARIDPRDLDAMPFVVPVSTRQLRPRDRFPDHAPARRVGATVASFQCAISVVTESALLGYVPEVLIRCQLNHGELRTLEGLDPPTSTPFVAWTFPDASRRAEAFVDAMATALVESLNAECRVAT
jgi:DNA-binding transcriptional LysR family regulator